MQSSAVPAASGRVAACSKVRFVGLRATRVAGTHTYCAHTPATASPKTSSPGRRSVTPAPTASTTPATSLPGTGCLGLRSPDTARISDGRPVTMAMSAKLSDEARTAISTSPAFGTGRGTVVHVSTSDEPYARWTTACMACISV